MAKKMRALGGSKATPRPRATASKARARARQPLLPVAEHWATVNLAALAKGEYGICLWGTRMDAEYGRDPDERVALVRVEIVEIR